MNIQGVEKGDHPQLSEIREASVRAARHCLAEDDLLELMKANPTGLRLREKPL